MIPGAIFLESQKYSSTETAFKFAVEKINKDKKLLPKSTLIAKIFYVKEGGNFMATKLGMFIFVLFYTYIIHISPKAT